MQQTYSMAIVLTFYEHAVSYPCILVFPENIYLVFDTRLTLDFHVMPYVNIFYTLKC